jgi:hypothetical protein
MFRTLRKFLRLGAIIGPLPNNIIDGTIIDAVPVMANYNWIISQVNANVPPLIPTFTALTAFTPTLDFGGASTGITYGTQVGFYVKIGSMVFFTLDIILTSKGSSTGNCNIDNLPFPINGSWPGGAVAALPCFVANVTFADGVQAVLESGTSRMTMISLVSGSTPTIITDAGLTNTSEIACTGFYSI